MQSQMKTISMAISAVAAVVLENLKQSVDLLWLGAIPSPRRTITRSSSDVTTAPRWPPAL